MKLNKQTITLIMVSILYSLLLSNFSFGQVPQKMSYQAVIRDGANVLVQNQTVGMQISVLQGSTVGTVIYVESHNTITNANGLVSIEIGTGNVIAGVFANIDWANGPYFIKTETDPTGGTNYSIAGTTQLLSVPYAMYAAASGSSIPGPQGPAGATGATGAQGPAGNNGATGQQGPAGATGTQGLTGATGAQGPIGNTGATGPQGPAGAQGAQGTGVTILGSFTSVGQLPATGAAGDSYLVNGDLYVWSTNTLSWSNVGNIQGPAGVAGPQGTQGPTGLTGATGPAGATGPQGAQGSQGLTGPQGPIGLTGPQGAAGTNGAVGAQGPQGPIGLTGATGAAGTNGVNGAVGATGPQGAAGANGTNGSNGADGKTVLNGTSNPTALIGSNGDFYINTITNTIFGPKASGAWPATGVSLVGPQGLQGQTGATGASGAQGATGSQGATGPMGPNTPGTFNHYIGEQLAGGIIFHLWKDAQGTEHGLIVDLLSLSNSIWSNITTTLVGSTAQSTWDGLSNSNAIVAQIGHTSSAALLCLNTTHGGQSDWYLPSADELSLLWQNRFNVNKSIALAGGVLIPSNLSYWSSTELNDTFNYAFYLKNDGAISAASKTTTLLVRAIRAF